MSITNELNLNSSKDNNSDTQLTKQKENEITSGDNYKLKLGDLTYELIIQLKNSNIHFYLKQDDSEIDSYFMKSYDNQDVADLFDLSKNKKKMKENYNFFVDLLEHDKMKLEKGKDKKEMKLLFTREGYGESEYPINLEKYSKEGKNIFKKLSKEINENKLKELLKSEINNLKKTISSSLKSENESNNKKINDSTNNQPTLQNNNNIEINMESKGENKDKTIIIPENQNLAIFNENPQQLRYETYITTDISSSEYELNSFDTFIGVKDNIYYLVYNNMKNFNIDIMNIAEKKVIKSLSGHYIRTSVIRYYLNSVKEEYILSCDINSKAIIWNVANDYTIKYILRMEYKSIIRDAILLFGLNQKNYLIISRASKEEYTKVYELAPNTPFVRNIPKPKKKTTNSLIPWKHNNKQYIIELCNGIISIKNVLENENFSDLNMEKDDNYLSGFIYKDHQLFVNITNKKQIIVLNLINRDIDKIINLPYSSFSLIQWSDRYGIVGSNDLEIVDLEKMEVVGFLNVKNTLYGIKKIKNEFFGEGFISCDEKKIVSLFCVYNK